MAAAAPWRVEAALGALLLVGCVSRTREPAPPEPFVFRSLDLRQQDGRGHPAWELTSPEARYDLIRRLAQARQPSGTVFRRGKPHITVQAQRGTVIGDGQAIQLEGDVLITLLGRDPVRIRGDQARWLPRQNLMVIDRQPVATNRRARVSAQIARYLLAEDRLELRGSPLLEQWTKPQPAAATRSAAPIRVLALSVDWRPGQGDLRATGPVRGLRSDLTLTASGLRGNLRQGVLDLLEPVRLRNRSGSTWLQARLTRWGINEGWLATDLPFSGALKQLRTRGDALRLDLERETALVPSGCRLDQPGEQLQAQRCLWHWPTGRFQASGAVELRRSAYRQITSGSQLNGRIGPEGQAQFSNPGARVFSQVTLPPRGPARPQQPRATPPVTF